MLNLIPTIRTKGLKSFFASINTRLTLYESLKDSPALLELVIRELKSIDQSSPSNTLLTTEMKMQCRFDSITMVNIIVLVVMSFLTDVNNSNCVIDDLIEEESEEDEDDDDDDDDSWSDEDEDNFDAVNDDHEIGEDENEEDDNDNNLSDEDNNNEGDDDPEDEDNYDAVNDDQENNYNGNQVSGQNSNEIKR